MPSCPKCNYHWESKSRSNPQNSYYWGVIIKLISEHLGYTTEETHEILKYKFLKIDFEIPQKSKAQTELVPISRSTTQLDTKEMEEYLSQVRMWASGDLGVFIPEPNEVIDGYYE